MNNDQIYERVIALVSENLPEAQEPLTPSSPLSETVLLESIMVLEIVMMLEEAFGISIDRADLDYFDTPGNIAELVAQKLSASPSR